MATIRDRYILEVDTKGAEKGIAKSKGSIASLGAGIARLGPLAVAAGAALGGMAAIEGIGKQITEMDDLAKAARNVGAATQEEFAGFQTASNLLAEMGISASETDRAFRNMTTRLQKAADEGKGPAVAAFEKLGSSILDTNGDLLEFPQLFEAVSSALADGTLTVVEAQGALGEMVGPKILGGMQDLADKGVSVGDALADVAANSNIVSLDAANQAEAFGDTMGRLGEVAGRLGTEITSALLPILVELAEGALAVLPGFIDGVKAAFDRMKPALDVIGTIFTEIIVPVLGLLFDILGKVADILAPLITLLADGLVAAITSVGDIVQTVVDYITGFVESLGNIQAKVSEITGAVGNKFSEMKDGIVGSTKDAYDGVTGWFGDMYNEVVGNSIVPDMAKGVLGSFDEMTGGMVSKIADTVSSVISSFTNVANVIGTKFEDLTGLSISNIKSQVSSLSAEVGDRVGAVADSVQSRFNNLKTNVGDFANQIGATGLIGGLQEKFAGFFANGGLIPSGQFGIVGERGPELVSGPATITPLGAAGGQQQVTYNINAVDARSFRDLVASDPAFIHAVATVGQGRSPARRRL
jgi:phage-related protein